VGSSTVQTGDLLILQILQDGRSVRCRVGKQ
jgi:hypothetical protein